MASHVDLTPIGCAMRADDDVTLHARVEALEKQLELLRVRGLPNDITRDSLVNDSLRTPYSMCVGVLLGNDASALLRLFSALLLLILMTAQLTLAYASVVTL